MSSQRVFVFVGVYDVYLNYKSNLIRLALLLGEGRSKIINLNVEITFN